MKKVLFATLADVETSLASYKKRVAAKPELESLDGKKLAAVVEGLAQKSGVSKLLAQASNIGEGKWAKNVLNNNAEGCTTDNKQQKVMDHITSSSAYKRLVGDPATKAEVEAWIDDTFLSE